VASGKGGVGKTSFVLNLAAAFAKKGIKTLVFDGDFGLANIDVQLGLAPEKDLSHVLSGTAALEDILVRSERGFTIIPGRSGNESLPFITILQQRDILKSLRNLSGAFDVVLIDVAAGVDDEQLALAHFADQVVILATPDPSSITDAYAMVKLLLKRYGDSKCRVVINSVASDTEGKLTYQKLNSATEKFLELTLPLVGMIPYDRQYAAAVKLQKLAIEAFPSTKAVERIKEIASKLMPAKPKL
jgi:flagellar biosynthesis protein FlhG